MMLLRLKPLRKWQIWNKRSSNHNYWRNLRKHLLRNHLEKDQTFQPLCRKFRSTGPSTQQMMLFRTAISRLISIWVTWWATTSQARCETSQAVGLATLWALFKLWSQGWRCSLVKILVLCHLNILCNATTWPRDALEDGLSLTDTSLKTVGLSQKNALLT